MAVYKFKNKKYKSVIICFQQAKTVYVSQTALSLIFYYSKCITSCGDLTVCMMEKGRYKRHCSSFPSTWVHIQLLVVVRVSHLVSFVGCVVFFVFCFLSSCFFFYILPPVSGADPGFQVRGRT